MRLYAGLHRSLTGGAPGVAPGSAPSFASAKQQQLGIGSRQPAPVRPAMRTAEQPAANQLLSPAVSLLEALSAPAAPHHLAADIANTSSYEGGDGAPGSGAPLLRVPTEEDEGGWLRALGSHDSHKQGPVEALGASPLIPPLSPSPLDAAHSPAAAASGAEQTGLWHANTTEGRAKDDSGTGMQDPGVHPPSSPFTLPMLQNQVAHAACPHTSSIALGLRTHHSLHQPMVATSAGSSATTQPQRQPQRAGSASYNGLLPFHPARGAGKGANDVHTLHGPDNVSLVAPSRQSPLHPSSCPGPASLQLSLPPPAQHQHLATTTTTSRVPRISEDPLSPSQVVATLVVGHHPHDPPPHVTRTPGRPLPNLEPTLSEDFLMVAAAGPGRDAAALIPDPTTLANSNLSLGRPSSSGLPLLLPRIHQPSLDLLGNGSSSMAALDEGMMPSSSLLAALSPQGTLRSFTSLPYNHPPSAAMAIPGPALPSSPWNSGTAAAALGSAATAAGAVTAGTGSGGQAAMSAAQALVLASSPRTMLGGSPLGPGMSIDMSTWVALERASSLKLHTSMSVVSQQLQQHQQSLLVGPPASPLMPGMVPITEGDSSHHMPGTQAMSPPAPTSPPPGHGGSSLSAGQGSLPRYCPNCTMPSVRSAGLAAPFCTYCGHQPSPASTAESPGYSGGRGGAAAGAPPLLPPLLPQHPHQPAPAQLAGDKAGVTLLSYDDRMLAHCEQPSPWGREHPERPSRLTAIMRRLRDTGVLARCQQIGGREASVEELVAVHDPQLVREVQAASLRAAAAAAGGARPPAPGAGAASAAGAEQRQQQQAGSSAQAAGGDAEMMAEQLDALLGGACLPERVSSRYIHDCPINGATYESARVAAGSAVEVAVAVASGAARNGAAIIRPPGHHAESGTSLGFCLFNNAAVAARAAQKVPGINRVLVMDWDVHHGNGTEQAFFSDKTVMYMSTHRYDNGMYYPGTGAASDVGSMGAEGYNVNVPFNGPGVQDSDILAAFRHVILPIAQDFRPDLVIVSAGFDAADGDPLGECHVTPECFGHLTAMLASLGPLVLLLEGGYNLDATAASTEACVRVLLGDPPAPLQADQSLLGRQARDAITAALDAQQRYWPSAAAQLSEVRSLPSPPSPTVSPTLEDEEMSMSGVGLMEALVPGTSAATMTAAALALSQDVNGGLGSLGMAQHGNDYGPAHSSPSAAAYGGQEAHQFIDPPGHEHHMEEEGHSSPRTSAVQLQQPSNQGVSGQGHNVHDSNNFAGMDWAEGSTHGFVLGSGYVNDHDGFDSVQWGTA